jgi:hypothetical protein
MPGYALQRSPVLDSHDVPWPRLNSVVSGRHQELVVHHSDFDVLIPSHSRIGKVSGGTRITMLLGTPG